VPRKVRQLKADLRRAGFSLRATEGSHTSWKHPRLPAVKVVISGNDGNDAQPYQERDVREALAALREVSGGRP
jgi:predicted RNA binding protein YcfA (HicA-like mRNA interferase family)